MFKARRDKHFGTLHEALGREMGFDSYLSREIQLCKTYTLFKLETDTLNKSPKIEKLSWLRSAFDALAVRAF